MQLTRRLIEAYLEAEADWDYPPAGKSVGPPTLLVKSLSRPAAEGIVAWVDADIAVSGVLRLPPTGLLTAAFRQCGDRTQLRGVLVRVISAGGPTRYLDAVQIAAQAAAPLAPADIDRLIDGFANEMEQTFGSDTEPGSSSKFTEYPDWGTALLSREGAQPRCFARFALSDTESVRAWVASVPKTPPTMLAALAEERSEMINIRVFWNPSASDEIRRAILADSSNNRIADLAGFSTSPDIALTYLRLVREERPHLLIDVALPVARGCLSSAPLGHPLRTELEQIVLPALNSHRGNGGAIARELRAPLPPLTENAGAVIAEPAKSTDPAQLARDARSDDPFERFNALDTLLQQAAEHAAAKAATERSGGDTLTRAFGR